MSRRKVLWFINDVPMAVAQSRGESSVRCGWLDSYIEIVGEEADIDLTVAFRDWTGRTPEARIGGVTFVGLPTGDPGSGLGGVVGRWRHGMAPPDVLAAAARLVRDVEPDLVHLHGAEECFGLALRDCGVPTVLSIQGSPTVFRRLYLRGFDRYCMRSLSFVDFLKGSGFIHEHVAKKAQAANEAVTMASVDHIAGRTDWDHRLASVMAPQAVYHQCDEPLRPQFHQASWRVEAALPGRIVCIMSGDYLRKGVGTLLGAVDILRRVEPGITLILAGISPGTWHERVTMRHVRALGIGDRVTLLGKVDARTIAEELTRASVFVIPSHAENSSNALCEAQLVGVPCVASSAGGLVTIADYGSAALLVQDGDCEELAGAVLSLMNNPYEAARLGERGRTLATARHDRGRIRAQILSIYEEMLA